MQCKEIFYRILYSYAFVNDCVTALLESLLKCLHFFQTSYIIPSLTVDEGENRCIPCIYWATAIFTVVTEYSNLFLSLTFFLDCPHFTFGYELIIRPETTDFVKVICDLFPFVQWDKSLLLYLCKVHCFQTIQQLFAGIFMLQLFLKKPIEGQCKKTDQEMCLDPILIL